MGDMKLTEDLYRKNRELSEKIQNLLNEFTDANGPVKAFDIDVVSIYDNEVATDSFIVDVSIRI